MVKSPSCPFEVLLELSSDTGEGGGRSLASMIHRSSQRASIKHMNIIILNIDAFAAASQVEGASRLSGIGT